jgi:hypothetical protein
MVFGLGVGSIDVIFIAQYSLLFKSSPYISYLYCNSFCESLQREVGVSEENTMTYLTLIQVNMSDEYGGFLIKTGCYISRTRKINMKTE